MNVFDLLTVFSRHLHRTNEIEVMQMCGLAEGTDDHTLKTTNDIIYSLYNEEHELVVTDNIPMTACAQQAIDTYCYYLVSVDAQGNVTVTKGTDSIYALPATPAGNVAIGAFKVVTDASTTFTSGTTDLSATGITASFYDINCGIALSLINQAMRKMERRFNFKNMKVRTTYTVTAGTNQFDNPIPNYKELIDVFAMANGMLYPISVGDIEYVEQKYAPGFGLVDNPVVVELRRYPSDIAVIPAAETTFNPDIAPNLQFLIRPIPDIDYVLTFTAYQYTPYLDGVIYQSNWWTNTAADVLLYNALVEAGIYSFNDRQAEWKALANDALLSLIKAEVYEEHAGSLQYLKANNVV